MRRSPSGYLARRRPRGVAGKGGGVGTTRKVVAGAAASLIICSLLGGSVATVVFDRSTRGDGAEPLAERSAVAFERTLRTEVAADPRDATAATSLANMLADEGELPEAIDRYEDALALEPGNAAIRFDFATTLAEAGRRPDAELQFRRVIEADAGSVEAHFYLAELYRTWEPPRTEDALALYRRVVALAPNAYLSDRAEERVGRLGAAAGTPEEAPPQSSKTDVDSDATEEGP